MALTRKEIDERYRTKDLEAYRKRKAAAAKTPEQRAIRTVYMRVWREKNREKHNAWSREYQRMNKEQIKETNRKQRFKKYGLTEESFNEMLNKQNGKCLICSCVFENNSKTHIDHCHNTGKVRGLLCSKCNGSLGWHEKYSQQIKKYCE